MARLTKAKSPAILPDFTIARFGVRKELEALLTATGIPFATALCRPAIVLAILLTFGGGDGGYSALL